MSTQAPSLIADCIHSGSSDAASVSMKRCELSSGFDSVSQASKSVLATAGPIEKNQAITLAALAAGFWCQPILTVLRQFLGMQKSSSQNSAQCVDSLG
jgi:hypothetical protein